MRKIISCIPNTITCLNLISGCVAIVMAFHLDEQYWTLSGRVWLYIAILAAALFDFCDGLSARLLRAYSNIGKELDSLADLVSFGVAPAMLVFNTMWHHTEGSPLSLAALLIAAGGALRLAKFNVDTTQTTVFRGLPIPSNALFWIGMSAWVDSYAWPGEIVMIICILLLSWLMISNIRMFSLKFKNLSIYDNVKRYAILLAAAAFLIVYGWSGLMWTIVLYILVSIFTQKHPD